MSLPAVVVGIQCRISSSRLPCKALLHLCDTTILGMCIQRAKNTGLPVFLLTSDLEEDDLIADFARGCGVAGVIRGSLDNVLSRYVSLAEKVSCDYLVRVTADNPLTEFSFIDPLIHHISLNSIEYSCVKPSLCPEGTNLEIFSKQALFESATVDQSNLNLEHVTHYMKQKLSGIHCLGGSVSSFFPFDCRQLSFTVDTLSDYIYLVRLINVVVQNLGIDWQSPQFVQLCAEYASNHTSMYAKVRNHPI